MVAYYLGVVGVAGSNPVVPIFYFRDVAQLGSAPCSGRGGRKFESCHPDHKREFFIIPFYYINCESYPNVVLKDRTVINVKSAGYEELDEAIQKEKETDFTSNTNLFFNCGFNFLFIFN